jgi:hypothetical protein
VTQQPLVHKILVPNMTMRGVMGEVGHIMACMAAPLVPLPPTAAAPATGGYRPPLQTAPQAAAAQ